MLPHLWEIDPRDPLFTFFLPSSMVGGTYQGTYGFYMLSSFFWIELLLVLVLHGCAAAVTGALLYKFIILEQPSKQLQEHKTASVSVSNHLLVYGVILPFWIVCPYCAIQLLDLRHLIFKFAVGVVVPILTLLRTTEALYGFTPKYATKSASRFVLYFSCPVILAPDKEGELVKVPFSKTLQYLKAFLTLLFALGMYSSWMVTFEHLCVYSYDGYDGAPSADDNDDWYSFHRFFTWQLYGNNLFQAILFQLTLQTYCTGLMFFFSLLCGSEIKPVMNNPVFASRSPSDFWGRRWNLLVHNALKNGVFKPARRYVSKTAAVAATFLVSGILHEWLLIALHAPMAHQQVDAEQSGSGSQCSNCVSVVYGSATIFFAWQGILVSIEALVGHWSMFTKLDKILPMPVRTALIIASGIPFAHYFADPYVRSSFFDHGMVALPTIYRIN